MTYKIIEETDGNGHKVWFAQNNKNEFVSGTFTREGGVEEVERLLKMMKVTRRIVKEVTVED